MPLGLSVNLFSSTCYISLTCTRTTDPNEARKQLHDALSQAVQRFGGNSDASARNTCSSHYQLVHSSTEQRSLQESPATSSNTLSSSSTSITEVDANQSVKTIPPKSSPARLSKSRTALESIGIPEPDLAATHRRRNRNPFTAAEDEALLKGYAVHGFQWTLIQRDKLLNLSHRKSTDLRDRFRNKFPDAYRHGASVSGKSLQAQSLQANGNSKSTVAGKQRPITNGLKKSAPSNNEVRNASQLTPRSMDSGFSPLAPPQTLLPDTANFQPPLDDHHTGSSVDTPLEDNTLPPLVWDELPD